MIREFIEESLIIVKKIFTDLIMTLSGSAFVRHQKCLLNLSPNSAFLHSMDTVFYFILMLLHIVYVESADTVLYFIENFIRHSVMYCF